MQTPPNNTSQRKYKRARTNAPTAVLFKCLSRYSESLAQVDSSSVPTDTHNMSKDAPRESPPSYLNFEGLDQNEWVHEEHDEMFEDAFFTDSNNFEDTAGFDAPEMDSFSDNNEGMYNKIIK